MACAVDEQAGRVAERLVVVNDQEVHRDDSMRDGSAWQAKGKGGAVARRAFTRQFSVHGNHELLDDAQTETRGRLASRGPRRKACIAVEHPRLVLFAEPGSFVLYLAFDVSFARRANCDANLLSGRRELDGVGQEIIQHLVEGGGVRLHESPVSLEGGLKDELLAPSRLAMLLKDRSDDRLGGN